MGVSTSPAELARKFAILGLELNDTSGPLARTGLEGKALFIEALQRKGVQGTTKVSKGVKARFDIKSDSVTIRYTGAAHLLNNRTRQHAITPKGVSGSRKTRGRRAYQAAFARDEFGGFGSRGSKRGNRAIVIPGAGPKAYALHPGTQGLKFFDDAKRAGYRELPKVYAKAGVSEPLRKAFS